MNRDQLVASAQALLDLDAKGALVPHGIGAHARTIIESFIALSGPLTFVIQIEADNSERYAIFSAMERAEAWAAKTPDLTHIFADLVTDVPEWGNEAVEQRQ